VISIDELPEAAARVQVWKQKPRLMLRHLPDDAENCAQYRHEDDCMDQKT
jgi:hypothetical protein